VNAAPVMGEVFAFESVIVSTDAAPGATAFGVKDFATVGCVKTSSVAFAAVAVPALVVDTEPVVLL